MWMLMLALLGSAQEAAEPPEWPTGFSGGNGVVFKHDQAGQLEWWVRVGPIGWSVPSGSDQPQALAWSDTVLVLHLGPFVQRAVIVDRQTGRVTADLHGIEGMLTCTHRWLFDTRHGVMEVDPLTGAAFHRTPPLEPSSCRDLPWGAPVPAPADALSGQPTPTWANENWSYEGVTIGDACFEVQRARAGKLWVATGGPLPKSAHLEACNPYEGTAP